MDPHVGVQVSTCSEKDLWQRGPKFTDIVLRFILMYVIRSS